MMATAISNSDDVIDSRDVIERITELDQMYSARGEITDDEIGERTALRRLHYEGANYSGDWEYGATLIRDSYFKEYAMELAEDIGAINADAAWPVRCIDWDQAAKELRMDYTSVDFDGVTYWVR